MPRNLPSSASAETAADIRADHPHLLDGNVEDILAKNIAKPMTTLAADRQRQMIALGVVFADHRAGFHVVGDDARIDDGDFRHRMRLGEGGFGCVLVADRCVEQNVAGMIRPDLRRIFFHRIDQTNGGWKRGPLDLDRLNGVARLLHSLRDHEGDGIADVTHDVAREDRIRRAGKGLVRQIKQTGKTAKVLNIVCGENRADAG